jgi:hypothetical protein
MHNMSEEPDNDDYGKEGDMYSECPMPEVVNDDNHHDTTTITPYKRTTEE